MNRRNFLQAILATGVAPFVVTTAGVLMPVKKVIAPDYVLTPPLVAFQDGIEIILAKNISPPVDVSNSDLISGDWSMFYMTINGLMEYNGTAVRPQTYLHI